MAKRILVVEDEQDHRELLKLIFGVHGYDVDTAANAQEAQTLMSQHHPDVMILDVMLPDIDGWTFCERVKHNEISEKVPVMMLSASAHMQPRFEGSCADEMLAKPFDEKELLAKVRHLLGD
ncbi:MAG TPA: response regulator transcription factor [Armatimonadota bacterium]|nr:response regulator transcription factor [Armatimonadota bacterium]